MKKKTKILLMALVLVLTLGAASNALAGSPVVVVDGQALAMDVAPVIENGRTLVPLRAIFEALNTSVEWDGSTQTITAVKGDDGTILRLTIGSSTAYRNGTPITLDTPARVVEGRTLVPLRFVSENLGAAVKWEAETQTVTITSANCAGST